jgi:hypothetical protein
VTEFKECISCAAKPGSPILCSSCLHNRKFIDILKRKEERYDALMVDKGYNEPAMTPEEHALVRNLGLLAMGFQEMYGTHAIVPSNPSSDLEEVCRHIRILQNWVLAQAAARAYPAKYRLFGVTQ